MKAAVGIAGVTWQEYEHDPDRCAKAKIPEEHRIYQPKWQQALDMVKRARANNVKFFSDRIHGKGETEKQGIPFLAELPRRHRDEEEFHAQIKKRHAAR